MGFESSFLAAVGIGESERRRKKVEEKQQRSAATAAQQTEAEGGSERTDELQRIGRSALISTFTSGVLNPERTGRKKLTAA